MTIEGRLGISKLNTALPAVMKYSNSRKCCSTAHFGDSNTNGQSKHDSPQGTFHERSIYRVIERTPAQTAEGLQKIEKFFQKKRDLWNSMTEEERQISISQFAMLDEYLKESRG